MLRNDWKFEYKASTLADAARKRLGHHEERLAFWRAKKDEVWATIRREGLEVNERIAMADRSPKSFDYERGAKVLVRNDLQADLDEVLAKLKYHTNLHAQFHGWCQALEANPDVVFELDIDDWQFFYGRNESVKTADVPF